MTTAHRGREEQALREVGQTDIRRGTAWVAVALFLATCAAVPLLEIVRGGRAAERSLRAPFAELLAGFESAVEAVGEAGLFAANRRLLGAMDRFETLLETESVLRAAVQPWGQWALTRFGGSGNEQVYVGNGGWLFYRPDVDHLTGPGFLEREVLAERALGGDAWEEPSQPDPMRALAGLERELARRGVRLLVMPVPGKASIHPERLSRRVAGAAAPLHNRSWNELERRLEDAGIEMFDPASLLAGAGRRAEPAYLATDTHWAPAAMELVAERLAALLRPGSAAPPGAQPAYLRREATVEAPGDITAMLRLPAGREGFRQQRVTVHPVLDETGRLWRPERGAAVLLLGDSFTNVFSDPALGWGVGAGLAEQLSYFLERPIDRIARNAGGAHAARQELARELAADAGRLAGVRVVVYEFAARELSFGDWKEIELP